MSLKGISDLDTRPTIAEAAKRVDVKMVQEGAERLAVAMNAVLAAKAHAGERIMTDADAMKVRTVQLVLDSIALGKDLGAVPSGFQPGDTVGQGIDGLLAVQEALEEAVTQARASYPSSQP